MHYKKTEEVFRELKTSKQGLTEKEADIRLKKYGYNEIKQTKKISPIKIFLEQFHNILIYILIAAVIISVFLGEKEDAIVIGVIVIANAIIGFRIEYKAEKSIEALKKLASLKAKVMRDGKEKEIDAKLLVPGDIIILETGEKIPADSRLLELINLQTQEAALTGESLPVKKELKVLPEKTSLADRINMIFSGTIITNGKGKAIVTSTGMQSQIGKIAKMIDEADEEPTPLQKKLAVLGRRLGIATLMIVFIVFITGVLKGEPLLEFFILAVALAVAGIPEGLPIVVTIGLSIGVQRMIKRNALVRKLPSVETLGSTTVICTDKTGTLTKNEMTVKKIYANGKIIDVSGSGYEKKGEFLHDNKKINMKEISLLLNIGALNNDAAFDKTTVIGDPTEAALIVSAEKSGINKESLQKKYPRKDEILFTSERKIMTTMHRINGENLAYVKGAPEIILKLSNSIYENGKVKKLTEKRKKEILEINKKFANSALRVLGFAYKTVMDKSRAEKNLIFVGLQGMMDPPREEVKQAITKCKRAGIKVVVITGDNEVTAKAVAHAIGIEGKSISGQVLSRMTEKQLEKHVEDISIYARVNPEHKNKIVEALKKKGHIVAMTGDGVNDAPALKKADIGVSMGITGTDVAKEASDMVLTDDNFASIVNAVEEGRDIYDNIKKFVEYLLSSNLGEILTIFIAVLIGLPLPLIAIMILWINLATDGLPALALSVDPSDPDIMERKPRGNKERIISNPIIIRMLIVGVTMMIGTLAVFKLYSPETNLAYAQTMAFSTLMFFQMFNVLNCRSEFNSLFKVGLFTNMRLWGAILMSIIMQVIVIHTPLNTFFKTIPLSLMDWVYVILISSSVFVIVEIYKFVVVKVRPDIVG
ncbi:MAG: calcium-transporting P-type ATPase, PMR1-type [Candidatus Woesearchaeota archaeon]|jgi:Ca2+-transporting ATPase|nr:calcium-transporting P-type ATPase, PMR1-type [Candidatus Woesearchaeota archaeon]MDP7623278.1 calcium-transporting P-type ATPase, PMR1-type [Candidatus Woesearchaeota archaeon]HJO02142.1 calcium-transporting P-type ATPase, PMR1-type [Candidatus Woesearchaeota archaeon]|tara:strand:+ start:155 stop:2782 length:2628 start_codon:yes stop_codon:yes gene_type:complete